MQEVVREKPGMSKSVEQSRWKRLDTGILLIVLLLAFKGAGNAQQPAKLVIKVEQANIYLEPDYRSRLIDILAYGKVLTRFGTGGEHVEWYYISYFSEEREANITGFVPAASVEVQQPEGASSDRMISTRENQTAGDSKIRDASDRIRKINSKTPSNLSISLQSAVFMPSDKTFSKIYGNGLSIGGNIDLDLGRVMGVSLNLSHYKGSGGLPLTQEATWMQLTALRGGIRLSRRLGIFQPYLKTGPVLLAYKEENPIGIAQGIGIGIFAQAGCVIPITRWLMIDGYIDYSMCKVKPQNISADLGGFCTGLGLGTLF